MGAQQRANEVTHAKGVRSATPSIAECGALGFCLGLPIRRLLSSCCRRARAQANKATRARCAQQSPRRGLACAPLGRTRRQYLPVIGPSGGGGCSSGSFLRSPSIRSGSAPNSSSNLSAVAWTCRRRVSWLVCSGNTSCRSSATFANGMSEAHLLSTYSSSGVFVPRSQLAAGRNVLGPCC